MANIVHRGSHRVGPYKHLWKYWTRGEGLMRWAASPTPWRTLRAQLARYVGPHISKGQTSKMFKAVMGIWPGERFGSNPWGPG